MLEKTDKPTLITPMGRSGKNFLVENGGACCDLPPGQVRRCSDRVTALGGQSCCLAVVLEAGRYPQRFRLKRYSRKASFACCRRKT
ncbi:hypothetical protein KKD61_01330 [Patescibacteria group bacterium]|nr:hypothetical protein [Patescibacteria group bacterium]